MSLILSWKNVNVVPVTVKIYRGVVAIDRNNLGTPIATLTAGETTYTDLTAVQGKLYYYVFETTTATDRTVSVNYQIEALTRRGPGTNKLAWGDTTLGYYGTVTSDAFLNTAQLASKVGYLGSTGTSNITGWYKFARNGKVLMLPNYWLASTISFNAIYALGAVYGVDNVGPYDVNLPTPNVNQKKIITVGSDQYIVRLMTGYSDVPGIKVPAAALVVTPVDTLTCEWNDLMYGLMTTSFIDVQRTPKLGALLPTSFGLGGTTGYAPWTQEFSEVNNRPTGRGNPSQPSAIAALTGRWDGVANNVSAPYAWYPVLELVE